jgi:hypothetical protein
MDTHSDLDQDHDQFRYPSSVGGTAEVAKDTGVDSKQKPIEVDAVNQIEDDPEGDILIQARAGVDSVLSSPSERPIVETEPTPVECMFEGEWINYFRDKAGAS